MISPVSIMLTMLALLLSGCVSTKVQQCNDYVETVKAKAYLRVLSCLYQLHNAELSKEEETRCDAIVKFVNEIGLNSYIDQ